MARHPTLKTINRSRRGFHRSHRGVPRGVEVAPWGEGRERLKAAAVPANRFFVGRFFGISSRHGTFKAGHITLVVEEGWVIELIGRTPTIFACNTQHLACFSQMTIPAEACSAMRSTRRTTSSVGRVAQSWPMGREH